ncbi:MAG: PP2C family protein-serine/threonine phosphatase [Armatimonadota bacterium]
MSSPSSREIPQRTSILLVDDHPGTLETLVDMFEDAGFHTATASTTSEALERVQEQFFNVALLDIWLPSRRGAEPDMHGTALLAQMRELRPETKCIMVTGDATFEAARQSLNEGAYAYIQKPFELRDVEGTVRRALKEQMLEQENRKLLAELQDVARTLAESFQSEAPNVPGLQIAFRLVTEFEVARFGGDFFDFIPLGRDRLGVVIGDVSGKGLSAHKYAAMAKYMLRAYANEHPSPAQVIRRLNDALYRHMSDGMFITMAYGVLDLQDGSFTFTNAGHPPPVVYHPETAQLEALKPTGGMVGAIEGWEFGEGRVTLQPGSVIALVTDGVTEARMGDRMLENEGVHEVVRENAAKSAEEIVAAINARAMEYAGGVLKDDVAIVVLKNAPSAQSGS